MWHPKWHWLHERTCVNNIFSKMSFLKSTCNFVLKNEHFENILRVPKTFLNVNLDRVIGKICQMQIFHQIHLEGLVNTRFSDRWKLVGIRGSGFRLCWFSLFPNVDDRFICTNMFSVFCEIDKLVIEKIEKEIFICNRPQYFAHKFTFKHKCNDDNILDVHGISASTTFR